MQMSKLIRQKSSLLSVNRQHLYSFYCSSCCRIFAGGIFSHKPKSNIYHRLLERHFSYSKLTNPFSALFESKFGRNFIIAQIAFLILIAIIWNTKPSTKPSEQIVLKLSGRQIRAELGQVSAEELLDSYGNLEQFLRINASKDGNIDLDEIDRLKTLYH